MRPGPRTVWLVGAGLVLALLPALGLPALWPAVLVFWAVLSPLLVVDALLSPRRAALAWSLETPEYLHVGLAGQLVLRARSAGRRLHAIEALVDVTAPLDPLPARRGRELEGELEVTWELKPGRRGVARFETLWMRYASPFELWRTWVREPLGREVAVLPDVPSVKAAALRYVSDRDARAGLTTERYRGDGSEFDSLKEFVRGDDRRAIDWKSSARHRKLLARHHRAERNHLVMACVDSGRLMSEPLGGLTRLDHALHGALLLGHACLRAGDQVGLFTFDSQARLEHPPAGGIGEMRPLIEAATRVRYSNEESNFTLGLTRLGQHLTRRSLIVLLTEFADTVSAELMLENVGRLVRRHVLVFVSIRDPELDLAVHAAPQSLEALSTAVVVQGLRRDRKRVHLDLQRLGVHVLDVPPDRVAPDLIGRYLEIRRRELI